MPHTDVARPAHTWRVAVLVWVPLLVLVACTPAGTGDVGEGVPTAALTAFEGCDALTAELQRRGLAQLSADGAGWLVAGATAGLADAASAAEPTAAAPVARGAGDAYSTTNVQEAGVDEPDIVKTDGSSVFSLADGALRVVDVRSDRPRVLATLRVEDGMPREMLLRGDTLLLLGDDRVTAVPYSDPAAASDASGLASLPVVVPRTRLWSVDVSEPSAPSIASTMVVDGGLLTARLTDATARVVVRSLPAPPDMVQPMGDADPAEALAVNRRRVRSATAGDWLPKVTVDDDAPAPLVECSAVRAPRDGEDMGLVSVLSLDLDRVDLDADRVDAVLGGAATVYADSDSLYVTTSRWPIALPVEPVPLPLEPVPSPQPEPPPLPEAPLPVEPSDVQPRARQVPAQPLPVDRSDVPRSEVPPSADPSPVEPPTRSRPSGSPPADPDAEPSAALSEAVPPRSPPPVTTEVHRFDLDDGGAEYVASGSVPGRVLNQWALSEHADDLRIATTVDSGAPGASHSSVHVLRREGSNLVEIGRTGDLGRGERIYAVRYAGPVGFVVTFRQVDPLYTLDLSDPTAPVVLGELKIPGYSAYLHPISEDHLLGVGQDATLEGRVTGLQVSLFDLSDLRAPSRVATIELGEQTSSPVEWDHRALLAWPDRNLVALPVERWDRVPASGLVVLTADGAGTLVVRGTIDLPADGGDPGAVRALVVADRLVTVSPTTVVASDLDTLELLGSIPL